MSWANGTVLKAGTTIYQIAEPVTASGTPQAIALLDSTGKVHWQGAQGGTWSSTKGWTLKEDLTVQLTATSTTKTTKTTNQTITRAAL